jgi:hypothetical protein
MPRWVLVSALVAGMFAFGVGALVGAHSKAGASSVTHTPEPGLSRVYNQPLRRKKTAKPATDAARSPSPKT